MQLLKPGADFAGRYEIVRAISTGGMGVVYEVLHRDTRRRRALKLMLPSILADDDMRSRFEREAIVTAGIESEHLVEVFDAGIEPETGAPFLVMELLRGEDLGARLRRRERTAPPELVQMFGQLALALARTHAAGIVHRDLKPENIFVTHRDDGSLRMKVLDFGIAKLVERSVSTTRSMGTPHYMPPEQLTGSGVGPAADLYALAHIAFTLLVGAPYFQAEDDADESVLALMNRVSRGVTVPPVERARTLGVELPASFAAWFERATRVDPAARFASVREQTDALREALQGVDALPLSSGAVRRSAELLPTLAADEQSTRADPGRAGPSAMTPASGGRDPSPAPARTLEAIPSAISTPRRAAESASGETGAGPSSRTLHHDRPGARRVAPLGLAAGVAVVAVGLLLWRSSGDPAEAPSGPAQATAVPEVEARAAATPAVAPERDPGPAPAPAATPSASASAVAVASARPAAVAPAPPSTHSQPPPTPAAPPTSRPVAPPPRSSPSPSVPAPPAPTVWGGPRR